jgi:RNA-directed DNA polymerase
MTERGHRLTRYADDFVICCKLRKGAERVLKSVEKTLQQGLGLEIHPEKTKIVDNLEEPFVFLGYVFKKGFFHGPSEKAVKKFKNRITEVTKRNVTVNLEEFVKYRVSSIIRGWGRYFGIGFSKTLYQQLDSWIRRRLRMIQLRSWREIKKLHKELRRRKWKGELPGLRMNRWRSSLSKPVHYAMTRTYGSVRGA